MPQVNASGFSYAGKSNSVFGKTNSVLKQSNQILNGCQHADIYRAQLLKTIVLGTNVAALHKYEDLPC